MCKTYMMCVCFVCKFFCIWNEIWYALIFSKLPQSECMHGTPMFQSMFKINLHATHIPRPPKCGKKSILNLYQNYQNRTQYMPQFCYKVQGLSKCCLKCMSLGHQGHVWWPRHNMLKKGLKYSSFTTTFFHF